MIFLSAWVVRVQSNSVITFRMTALSEKDLRFLCDRLNLPAEKVRLLSEEERDLDLILEQIALFGLWEREPLNISDELFFKIVVFKNAKDYPFDITEKSYIAKCLAQEMPKIISKRAFIRKRGKAGENESRYYLVMLGLFDEFLLKKENQSKHFFLKYIDDGFRKDNKRDVANHLSDWLKIFSKIKEETLQKPSKLCKL